VDVPRGAILVLASWFVLVLCFFPFLSVVRG